VIGLILGALIAVAAVVIVSLPLVRSSDKDDELELTTPRGEVRMALVEERDRTLAALKELEFDHRTGKVDDADYRALVGPLRRAAASSLQALDALDYSGAERQGQ
jgi:hypothetical protein